jgi:hypothetical protein
MFYDRSERSLTSISSKSKLSAGNGAFAARVNLPCRVFCGPESALELAGTAISIDTGSLVLAVSGGNGTYPVLGERVRVELSLPAGARRVGERYLAVRARVTEVSEGPDGARRVTMAFRKPSFKERADEAARNPMKAAVKGWAM